MTHQTDYIRSSYQVHRTCRRCCLKSLITLKRPLQRRVNRRLTDAASPNFCIPRAHSPVLDKKCCGIKTCPVVVQRQATPPSIKKVLRCDRKFGRLKVDNTLSPKARNKLISEVRKRRFPHKVEKVLGGRTHTSKV